MKVNLELYSQRALEVFQTALKLAAKMGHGSLEASIFCGH